MGKARDIMGKVLDIMGKKRTPKYPDPRFNDNCLLDQDRFL